jgi:hypothetical protein
MKHRTAIARAAVALASTATFVFSWVVVHASENDAAPTPDAASSTDSPVSANSIRTSDETPPSRVPASTVRIRTHAS